MNKGEIISKEIEKHGFKKSRIAKDLKITRATLDRRLIEPNPPINFIEEISKITGIDFFVITASPKPYQFKDEVQIGVSEPQTTYQTQAIITSKYENMYYRKCEEFEQLMALHTKVVTNLMNKEKTVAIEFDAFRQQFIECTNNQTKAISEGLVNISRQIEQSH